MGIRAMGSRLRHLHARMGGNLKHDVGDDMLFYGFARRHRAPVPGARGITRARKGGLCMKKQVPSGGLRPDASTLTHTGCRADGIFLLLPILVPGAILLLGLAPSAHAAGMEVEPLKVIFDTDMDGDNDDVAAAAILHALADSGTADILAMGVVSRCSYSPACLDAINTYYGRGDIPIGVYKGTALAEMGSPYAKAVAERCPHDLGLSSEVPDVVGVYRRVLSGQLDGTVTMIVVGQMNNLVDLLASPPDRYSDLAGRDLVRRKVATLFVMAPYFNERNEYQRAYNFVSSPKAARELIAQWPTKIKFGEGNLGHQHFIGSRLSETPAGNPSRIAFEAYFAGQTQNKRHCADPTTVLYAVCGTQYFGEVGPGACDVREDGYTRWDAAGDKQHFYNTQKLPVEELEQVLEQLLIKPPKLQRPQTHSR